MESSLLVLGADVGGTKTRVVVAAADGRVVGRGYAGGGNPSLVGERRATSNLEAALGQAVSRVDPGAIGYGALAIAGWDELDRAWKRRLDALWAAARLTCPYALVSDVEAAFASVSTSGDGIAMVAGTGAVAAQITDWHMVKRADGHGWLVGDDGSAHWLGREAVRAALAAIDGRGPATALVDAVAHALDAPPELHRSPVDTEEAIVRRVYGIGPSALPELAPLVTGAAQEGDAVARNIVRRACGSLMRTLVAVWPEASPPVELVLGGSVLTTPNALSAAVQNAVRRRLGVEPLLANDGALGAVALARRDAEGWVTGRGKPSEPGRDVDPSR